MGNAFVWVLIFLGVLWFIRQTNNPALVLDDEQRESLVLFMMKSFKRKMNYNEWSELLLKLGLNDEDIKELSLEMNNKYFYN